MPETPRETNAFLRPLWVRVLIILFCAGWCAYEWLYNQDQFWGLLTLAATAWGIWELLINFEKKYGPPPGSAPKS